VSGEPTSRSSRARSIFNATARPIYTNGRDAMSRAVERHYGLETGGTIELRDLGLDDTNRERYRPTEWLTLPRALHRRDVDSSDVFVDFGSGLGRVVFQAALWYPFKRVEGVELSEDLHETAVRNIERNRSRLRCRQVDLKRSDVLDYEIPSDVTVAFFANPFHGPVFDAVLHRLIDSVDAHPREVRMIYRNPKEHRRIVDTGRFEVVKRLRGWRPGSEWSRSNSTITYRLRPRSAA
jgi:hypothetical protein